MSVVFDLTQQPYKGQAVFCIGGGPSLRDFDWDMLRGLNTIGCNAAYKLGVDIVKYCFFADHGFLNKGGNYVGLAEFSEAGGIVITHAPSLHKHSTPWLYYVEREPRGCFKHALGFNGSSGASAINLALILGASRVYLLGYDNQTSAQNLTHWHDYYRKQVPQENVAEIRRRAGHYTTFKNGYKDLLNDLRKKPDMFPGARIINLNMESALDMFPKRPLNTILPWQEQTRPQLAKL